MEEESKILSLKSEQSEMLGLNQSIYKQSQHEKTQPLLSQFSQNYSWEQNSYVLTELHSLLSQEQLNKEKQDELASEKANQQSKINRFVTWEQFNSIYSKYRKYKQLYQKEIETSKRLRAEFRKISDKLLPKQQHKQ